MALGADDHPLPHPGTAFLAIAQAVVQAALAALPELPLIGLEAVATPVRRARRHQHELRAKLGGIGHQHAAARDHLALRAGPGANARIQRTAGKVFVAFGVAHFFDNALDAHHAFQLYPVELQRHIGVAGNLAALAAVVIGKPDDAALVKSLDQDHARAGAHVAAHGGHGHGVGLGHFRGNGFFQPLVKLLQGGCVRGVFVEFGALVALAKVGDREGHGHDCARRKSLAATVFRGFGSDRLLSNLYSLILARQ